MVQWSGADPAVDRSVIALVETECGVRFPQDYVECAMVNSGGSPSPACFLVGEAVEVFDTLLSYRETDPWHGANPDGMLNVLQALQQQDLLPEGVFPFAYDPGGNFLAFDYRTSREMPSIVFLDHERLDAQEHFKSYPVASTFTELLANLHESDEDVREKVYRAMD